MNSCEISQDGVGLFHNRVINKAFFESLRKCCHSGIGSKPVPAPHNFAVLAITKEIVY
jgi:hypothetical protein